MIICNNCFCDSEIQSRIISHNVHGICPICNNQDAYIYDTKKDDYLNGIFDKILNIYTPVSAVTNSIAAAKQTFINDELLKNWNIFNHISDENAYIILKELSSDLYDEIPELFDEPVVNLQIQDSDCLNKNSILKNNNWDDFVNALKHENRFHTNHVNTDILKVFCSYIRKTYKKGEQFVRGRISDKTGFDTDNIKAPPSNKATDGRANSAGISRLYLANDIETTIHEIRAEAFDYITIGYFELKEEITVVDLKMINKISPFIEDLDALQYFINREHLNKINEEMGKTLRRSDSPLDYVPTQYITDFIQSITHGDEHEYSGIEYKSTLYPQGYNLAIFDPSLFECVGTEIYQVKELTYRKEKI